VKMHKTDSSMLKSLSLHAHSTRHVEQNHQNDWCVLKTIFH